MQGVGCGVQGVGCGVQGAGCGVWGAGCVAYFGLIPGVGCKGGSPQRPSLFLVLSQSGSDILKAL